MSVEAADVGRWPRPRAERRASVLGRRVTAKPELLALLALTGVLNLWGLGINGWANTYYSAAVRSMSTSWHDFIFAAMDRTGLMTVDKPPLALWVQALSARIFGFHPLSLLVPQALMGVVASALVYDLTRRRFGRPAGFVAGLTLATTPIIVAVSRHNNPDELLVLCATAAVWFAARGLEDGRFRWIAWSAVCVGLGFETKMLVAFLIVPGIAAAWLYTAPGSVAQRLRRLTGAGLIGGSVALAWPLLVTLTPAADRPWISGTSDNTIWSLIFGYNGLGRVAGQTGGPAGAAGGPGGAGGSLFGGSTGPLRLLNTALADQAGWLLGAVVVSGLALLVITRLRRRDPHTGWLLVVGGGFATSAVVFSFARGIFHPYYVSFLAPYAAALIGAGFAVALSRRGHARIVGPLLLAGGAVTELVVLGQLGGALAWAKVLIVLVAMIAVGLALAIPMRVRAALLAAALALLLAAPATWAAETLGHATSGTFPAGGPAGAAAGGPGGGPGGGGLGASGPGGFGRRFDGGGRGPAFGAGGATGAIPGSLFGGGPPAGFRRGAGGFGPGAFGGDSTDLQSAIAYAASHGGGTIGVESQSSAASLIVASDARVAGLGGFSGRESSVTASWLAGEVASGRLRWIVGASTSQTAGLPGGTRTGSQSAFTAVAKACKAVTLSSGSVLYDCQGRAAAIASATST